jgi:hypothetical protein
MDIKLAHRGSPEWTNAVDLVRQKYRRVFEADAMPDPDCFVVCLKPDAATGGSRVVACAGMTFGHARPFFSEQYLDEPIQHVLSRMENQQVSRESIVEIGSMASVERNAGIELIRILPLMTLCMGKQYGLMTSTEQLRGIFDFVGIPFVPLTESDGQRLGANALQAWGRYYENAPMTGFIRVEQVRNLAAQAVGRYRFSFSNEVVGSSTAMNEVA